MVNIAFRGVMGTVCQLFTPATPAVSDGSHVSAPTEEL